MSRKPLLFQNEYYIIRTKIGGFVNISRRKAVKMMAVSSALFCSGIGAVLAGKAEVSDQINNIVSGSQTRDADVFLDVPEIAENGNQVKVAFEIESPMSDADFVKEVYILADGNPAPNVAKFNFTPYSGECFASTRMRLSKTQDVYLIAKFSDDTHSITQSTIKVTIGGCGG